MKLLKEILQLLQTPMQEPKPFGWFHIMWIVLIIITLIILYKTKSEKKLNLVLGTYGIVALILEILKQISWTISYDNGFIFDYQWYAFPFQFCTTPIYVCLLCLFIKDGKLKDSLLSYLSFVTILGSIMTVLMPESCLIDEILVNIHTMWLHCGSLVISIYLVMKGIVKINKQNLKNSFIVFLVFVLIAQILNISTYNFLNGEEFNMFYISPYYISSLPVYDFVQTNVPYILYFIFYLITVFMGSLIVYFIFKLKR